MPGQVNIQTYFTKANGLTELFYSAEFDVRLRMELETAGPVSIGTREDLAPVLSGRGRLLPTGEEREIFLRRGDRVYIISNTTDRVAFTVEPVPILPGIARMVLGLGRLVGQVGKPPPAAPQLPEQGSDWDKDC